MSNKFIDGEGNEFILDPRWRDFIHPNWRTMLESRTIRPKSDQECVNSVNHWIKRLKVFENFLMLHGLSLRQRNVLEIGAYDGPTAYALAHLGAGNVTGSDINYYYINQNHTDFDIGEHEKTAGELAAAREAYRAVLSKDVVSKVTFVEDDISDSKLPSASHDAIISFEVLEHVTKPLDAFNHMARILKPGGFAFHEYNPFFSVIGGHSLASAEFPWGHTRLSRQDFERMIVESRPSQREGAMKFYENALNRMALKNLKEYAAIAGLDLLALIPFPEQNVFGYFTPDVLSQTQKIYPDVNLIDLTSRFVWVLLQKKGTIASHVYG